MFYWLLPLLLPLSLISKEIVTIYAVDRISGKVIIDEGSDLAMTPASVMKILTTAAALHILGENHRFTTTLEYDGDIIDNILYGNVYIRGGGDPCLGAKDWEHQLHIWAGVIKDLGISKIQGRIIADSSAWETALAPSGWSWDDLGNYYGAGASALSFHENCYKLNLKPSEVGGKVTICSTYPYQFDLILHNELVTGPIGSGDQAYIYGSEYCTEQFLRGSIPAGVEQFTIKGSIPNPPAYLEKLFTKVLQESGIALSGIALAKGCRIPFHTTSSPTVAEIVHETNRRSMNLYAEHLLKAMGDGWANQGVKVVKNFYQSLGIDLTDAQITDGSGLSRTNLLSAKQCVDILCMLEKSPHFPTFFNSLPEDQGIRVKSGTMSLVKGYVGYSNKLVFAFFIGQCPDLKKKIIHTEALFKRLKNWETYPPVL
jgi:D-alanyl-D-alanine carboxypeptidase/D-alanyl-D-alanine-endopeptidase (penicillin-binding protein 4)